LYRTKEALKQVMQRDPITLMQNALLEAGIMTEDQIKALDKEMRERVMAAIDFADKSPWPDPHTLEEDVFAP
jgi:pyruvate dehydrogenase E1 component alpha subunit